MIRPATNADLTRLREIQAASPEASTWNPLEYDCIVATQDRSLWSRLGSPRAATEGSGSYISGFLVSRETIPGEREILNVAVDPHYRRHGIGKMLVEAELSRGKGAWFLEVRESNTAAIAIYRSFGFEPAGRRPGYYHTPTEAAIVMRFLS